MKGGGHRVKKKGKVMGGHGGTIELPVHCFGCVIMGDDVLKREEQKVPEKRGEGAEAGYAVHLI